MTPLEKEQKLRRMIREMGSMAIAYSGGVDSTYLFKIAADEIGSNALAVTASSPAYPARERQRAQELARQIGARQITIESKETEIPQFVQNPPNRCYYCKLDLFQHIAEIAVAEELSWLVDGSTHDDLDDHRPGMAALKQMQVRSPLRECGFTKDDIRQRSKELGLPTWNLPSFACLASRFPYGTTITEEALRQVDLAESALYDLGFRVIRVRHHGDTARIEIGQDEINRLLEGDLRNRVVEAIKEAGYKYVSLDLEGYRTGSMNEVLGNSNWNAR